MMKRRNRESAEGDRPSMHRARAVLAWAGLLAVVVGVGAFDWRLGLAAGGAIAFIDACRPAGNGPETRASGGRIPRW